MDINTEQPPILHRGKHLLLRRSTPTDAELLFKQAFGEQEFMRMFRLNGETQSVEQLRTRLQTQWQMAPGKSGYLEMLVIHKDHGPVGVVALADYSSLHRRAETLTGIFKAYRHLGYGVEAKLLMLDMGFNHYGLHKVDAYTYAYNLEPQQGMLRLGFRSEGVRRDHLYSREEGEFIDLCAFGMMLEEFRDNAFLARLSRRLIGRDITNAPLHGSALPAAVVSKEFSPRNHQGKLSRKRVLTAVVSSKLGTTLPVMAANLNVTEATDDGTGTVPYSLSWAIRQANVNPGPDTIILNTDVAFTGVMKSLIDGTPAAGTHPGGDLIIRSDATPRTINGGDSGDPSGPFFRPFFVKSGNVIIRDLTISNSRAEGASTSSAGGAGAGLGGALFVYDGNVMVRNVAFDNCGATGGSPGSSGGKGGYGGGGGGMIGFVDASDPANNVWIAGAGGGGLFTGTDENTGEGGYGGNGYYGGSGGGALGGAGGFGGGGGMGANGSGKSVSGGTGGTGGFGGGGGLGGTGSGEGYNTPPGTGGAGGQGGFGGGGGFGGSSGLSKLGLSYTSGEGGTGGFGGGGGSGNPAASGGYGGGAATAVFDGLIGGGGAGFGGAIFAMRGSTTLMDVSFSNNSVAAGAGGSAAGADVFICSDQDPLCGATVNACGTTSTTELVGSFGTDCNYDLTVKVVGSDGVVTSAPQGIDCGSSCSGLFTGESTITLNAAAVDSGVTLSQVWGGDCAHAGGGTVCLVKMTGDKQASIEFNCDLYDIPATVSQPVTMDETWQCTAIKANKGFVIYGPSGNVTFKSKSSIELGAGFRVIDQARFRALIAP